MKIFTTPAMGFILDIQLSTQGTVIMPGLPERPSTIKTWSLFSILISLTFLNCSVVTTRIVEDIRLKDNEQSSLPIIQEKHNYSFSISGSGSWYGDQDYRGNTKQNTTVVKNTVWSDSTIHYIGTPNNFTIEMPNHSFDLGLNAYLKYFSINFWMTDKRLPTPKNYGMGGSFYYNFPHFGISASTYFESKSTVFDMEYLEKSEILGIPNHDPFERKKLEDKRAKNQNTGSYLSIWANSIEKWKVIPYFFFGASTNSYQVSGEDFELMNNHRYVHGMGVKLIPLQRVSILLSGKRNEIIMDGGGNKYHYIFNLKSELHFTEVLF